MPLPWLKMEEMNPGTQTEREKGRRVHVQPRAGHNAKPKVMRLGFFTPKRWRVQRKERAKKDRCDAEKQQTQAGLDYKNTPVPCNTATAYGPGGDFAREGRKRGLRASSRTSLEK